MKVDVYSTAKKNEFVVVPAGASLPEAARGRGKKLLKSSVDLDGNRGAALIGVNVEQIKADIAKNGFAVSAVRVQVSEVKGDAPKKT